MDTFQIVGYTLYVLHFPVIQGILIHGIRKVLEITSPEFLKEIDKYGE